MVEPLWKTVWQLLTKLNILFPYDSAIMLPGIYPNKVKLIYSQKFTHR